MATFLLLAAVWWLRTSSTPGGVMVQAGVPSPANGDAVSAVAASTPQDPPEHGSAPVDAAQAAARTVASAPLVTMPKQDHELLLEAAKKRDASGVFRFATGLPVNLTPTNAGVWGAVDGGKRTWRLRVSSPGASSLNLGFQRYHMPEGGRMVIYPAGAHANASSSRTFTEKDNEEHGQLWTPLFSGGELVIEVEVPAAKEQELDLVLTRVNHGFRQVAKVIEKIGEAATESCHIDVACSAATLPGLGSYVDSYRDQIRAMGAFTLNGIEACSGVLINNTAGDGRPFFVTANHCGITAGNAPSMVAYWNFQNSSCRTPGCCGSDQPGDGSLNQFNTGVIFRASYEPSDFTLVEFDDLVDPAFKTFFAGWDRSGAQTTAAATVHHPSLAEKRISFSFNASTTTGWSGTSSPGDGTHARVFWSNGCTEPGSSGSPLFDQNKRIIGQLHGGDSHCDGTGSDWFGRISVSWEGGGTNSTRLKNWLDPLNSAVAALDGRNPAPMLTISDASLTEGHAGSATMTFTVTLDPAATQMVTVNYSTASDTATSPSDFATASGTVTFSPGQLKKTISVSIVGDTQPEGDERFFVQLSNATNAVIYRAQAAGIILNDDYLAPTIDSSLTGSAYVAQPFTYTIHGTNTPRTFALGGIPPAGMTVQGSTGILSWTPSAPGTYNVQIIASNPAGSDTKTLQIQAGYGVVDLSAGLPPVADQGTLGSSSAFAICYYYKTYQEGKEHNWSLTDPTHQFSPTFLINQTNISVGYSPSISEMLDLMAERGCAPLSVAPYTPADTSTWPVYAATLAALPFRSAGDHALGGGGTPEIIDRMRAHLASGDLCVMEFERWRPAKNTKGSFELLTSGNDHYDLPMPSEKVSGGLQAVTVVGYDDSQFVGRGGFKIVASFGTSWGAQGFAWVSYDFVRIFAAGVYVMDDRIGYTPAATARVAFSHSEFNADHVTVTLGTGPDSTPSWSSTVLDGNQIVRDQAPPDMAFDLTDAAGFLPPSPNQKWWVNIYDGRTDDVITLSRFEITMGATTWSAAQVMPLVGSEFSGTVTAYIPSGENSATQYYVNDGVTAADVYTTAAGNNANDGLTPATPKASIQAVLDTYTLKAGDTVWVDAGTYPTTTTITQLDRGVVGNPVRFVGVLLPNGEPGTILDRTGNTVDFVFSMINNAQNIQLENVWIKGGANGVNHDGSWGGADALTLRNVRISGTSAEACRLYEAAPVVLENCLLYGFANVSSGTGLGVYRSTVTINRSTIHAPPGKSCVSLSSSSSDYASNANLILEQSILFGQKISPTDPAMSLISVGSYSSVNAAKYSVLYAGNGATIGITPDATNVLANPLFASPATGDYHEQSTAGRWDAAANAGAGAWVTDASHSPAIDAGDLTAAYGAEPVPHGGRMNAGAFGGTTFASKSAQTRRYLVTTAPLAAYINHSSVTVTWVASGDAWLPGDTVRVEYTTDGGTTWIPISGASALAYSASSFVWIPSGIPDGVAYQVRVIANGDANISGTSPGPFTIHYPVLYYVNDGYNATSDIYCTTAGSAGNDGLTPATPKDSVQAVLDAYTLKAGDVLHVDSGTYTLSTNIIIGSADSGDSSSPVTLRGSTGRTVLIRSGTSGSSIQLNGVSYLAIEGFEFRGGASGISQPGSGYNPVLLQRNVFNATGVSIYRGTVTAINNTFYQKGYSADSSNNTLRNNIFVVSGAGISAASLH